MGQLLNTEGEQIGTVTRINKDGSFVAKLDGEPFRGVLGGMTLSSSPGQPYYRYTPSGDTDVAEQECTHTGALGDCEVCRG